MTPPPQALRQRRRRLVLGVRLLPVVVLLLFPFLLVSSCSDSPNSNSTTTTTTTTSKQQMEKTKRYFQDPEFQSALKDYWKQTLAEIRNLAGGGGIGGGAGTTKSSSGSLSTSSPTTADDPFFFNQWKQLLDDPQLLMFTTAPIPPGNVSTTTTTTTTDDDIENPLMMIEAVTAATATTASTRPHQPKKARFEGFVSWDRLLQDWSDEIQAYLDRVQDENNDALATGGDAYPLSTYGRPPPATTATPVVSRAEEAIALGATISNDTESTGSSSIVETAAAAKNKEIAVLPVPASARPDQEVLPHTNVRDKSKRIWIVTTASLPWKTGTAVNPLLRAAYLTLSRDKEAGGSVTLMLPWLERPSDQDRIYGRNSGFNTPQDQEDFIRNWLRDSAKMPQASVDLNIQWYTGWQNPVENSIYSMGDITALIPDDACDIMILEEPEHLNWYRAPGESWTKKFKHVVGILHTNYFQYVLDQPAALIRGPTMKLLCSWMCRAHCHRVIKLSGTLGKVAPEKELVENVHGVRETFLDVGRQVGKLIQNDRNNNNKGAAETSVFASDAEPTVYFLGKLLWSKGLGSLMELLKYAEETADLRIKVDMYGGGPDQGVAEAKAQKLGLDMPFHGPLDHAELAFTHKIFVNPSTSEVLCTASAEALAMGKFVILPSHPSNDFFAQFPNCLAYATKEEFVGNLYYAMTHAPEPLTPESLYALSWEAATERFAAAACIPVEEAEAFAAAHVSQQAAIEISLPPLVEDDSARRVLASTLRQTRDRYRSFRLRLSSELRQSKVLPKQLRDRLVVDLEKQLDIDIDELLESPKLRLQLSPAELDKSLLELYNTISESPSGDLFRLIGGGGAIGLQNMYMRRQTQKKLMNQQQGIFAEFFPSPLDDRESEDARRTPAQRVQWALRKYVPNNGLVAAKTTTAEDKALSSSSENRDTLSMSAGRLSPKMYRPAHWSGLRAPATSFKVTRRPLSLSLLI